MGATASHAGNPSSSNHLPLVVYFEGDMDSRKALAGMHRFMPAPFGRANLANEAGVVLLTSSEQSLAQYWGKLRGEPHLRVVALSDERFHDPRLDGAVFAYLPANTAAPLVERMIDNALSHIHLTGTRREFNRRLAVASVEINELNQIGTALSAEHDTSKLLEMILSKSRQITRADAGSLYLVEDGDRPTAIFEGTRAARELRHLRFALAQNDSLAVPFREVRIEISRASIAGYVALMGETVLLEDAYDPPPGLPFRFNQRFDEESGYRTKSILAVPMRDQKKRVVGVVQLINCKREVDSRRAGTQDIVVPFTEHHCQLMESLASQAAVALENSRLVAAIERSFEGFVRASVTAIEGRDPATCGHSSRVANLTLGLAEAVNSETTGRLAAVHFSADEMKEIRYAALLHDFGKLGVREEVLLKATKLYPAQLELLRQRFAFAKRTAEAESLRERLEYLLTRGESEYEQEKPRFDALLEKQWAELDSLWDIVEQANLPTVNPDGDFEELAPVARHTCTALDGTPKPLLDERELRLLSIRKGSLDEGERAEIEAHVANTFRFLSQIPWTSEVRGIPVIARAHHEKLNGSGYPQRLSGADIPLQARMIAIADMFDGLTSCDRPYKKAATPEEAITILQAAVADGEIDPDLFRLFVQTRVWERRSEQ